jgi:hypothetical protein
MVGAIFAYRFWISAPMTDARLGQVLLVFFVGLYATLAIAIIIGTIFVKRIYPPTLADFEEYSKQAHYTAP